MYQLTIAHLDGKVEVYSRETREEMQQLVNLFNEKNRVLPKGSIVILKLPENNENHQ